MDKLAESTTAKPEEDKNSTISNKTEIKQMSTFAYRPHATKDKGKIVPKLLEGNQR